MVSLANKEAARHCTTGAPLCRATSSRSVRLAGLFAFEDSHIGFGVIQRFQMGGDLDPDDVV